MAKEHPTPENLLKTAVKAAKAGGAELMSWRGRFTAREKAAADLVTDADFASQAAVEAVIRGDYPDHAFVGEENPAQLQEMLAAPICWVVDPLDGTTNYVHGFPAFAVSVAVLVEGRVAAGAIFDPLADELYTASRGNGAFCNAAPLTVTQAKTVETALLAFSLPPQVDQKTPDLIDYLKIVESAQGVRRMGSAALNLAYLAQGRLDGHWARKIQAWDIAAGLLLVEEAGGVVTSCTGEAIDWTDPHFIATCTKSLHDSLIELLART